MKYALFPFHIIKQDKFHFLSGMFTVPLVLSCGKVNPSSFILYIYIIYFRKSLQY